MLTFLSILHLLICIQSREVWTFWKEFEEIRVCGKFMIILSVNDKFQMVYGQSHRSSFVLLIIFFSSLKQEIFGKHGPLWIRFRHFIQVSHFSSLELIGLSWSPDVSLPFLRTHGWLQVNFHIFYISRTT